MKDEAELLDFTTFVHSLGVKKISDNTVQQLEPIQEITY